MAIERNIGPSDDYFTGEDKTLPFTIYQSDETTLQDITGWSLSWMVKRRKADPDSEAILRKTTADDITITNGPTGAGRVDVDDADIVPLLGGNLYHHELKRTDSGFGTVLIHGTFQLAQAVHE